MINTASPPLPFPLAHRAVEHNDERERPCADAVAKTRSWSKIGRRSVISQVRRQWTLDLHVVVVNSQNMRMTMAFPTRWTGEAKAILSLYPTAHCETRTVCFAEGTPMAQGRLKACSAVAVF